MQILLCTALTAVGVSAWMMPLFRYLRAGWAAKRKDIMDGLNAESRCTYFTMFSPGDAIANGGKSSAAFEKLYSQWYGRRFFIAPGILFFFVGLLAVTPVVLTSLHGLGYLSANPLFELPVTAMAAIAGAYLWVVNDLVSRARRLDFSPADLQWSALRVIIAIPMGYAFASIAAKEVGPFVAFSLGAFPLGALTSMLQRLAKKSLSIDESPKDAQDGLIKLQGINRTIVERLADEDIATVTQIAYCDPVRLVMRSNLTFSFVTDCMSQALAWLYFEDRLGTVLRSRGLRGAVEIASVMSDYDDRSDDARHKQVRDECESGLTDIAKQLDMPLDTLLVTLRQIAEDPYTLFLCKIWNSSELDCPACGAPASGAEDSPPH